MAQQQRRPRRDSDNQDNGHVAGALVLGQLTGNPGPAPGVSECRRRLSDRRRRSLGGFFYGNFRPRRRGVRRSDEHHRILFDWHEPRVLYVALAVLLLSCTDALFTLNLLLLGANEANVFMDSLLARGVDAFLAIKISLTACSVVLLVGVARRRFLGLFPVIRLLQLVCIGYLLLIAYELWLFSVVFGFGIAELMIFLPGAAN